jgi:hypothetical protein
LQSHHVGGGRKSPEPVIITTHHPLWPNQTFDATCYKVAKKPQLQAISPHALNKSVRSGLVFSMLRLQQRQSPEEIFVNTHRTTNSSVVLDSETQQLK